jgi:hypothetical protein
MDREKDCYRENVEAYHRYAIKILCAKLRETNRDKKEVKADFLSQIKELNNKLEDTNNDKNEVESNPRGRMKKLVVVGAGWWFPP